MPDPSVRTLEFQMPAELHARFAEYAVYGEVSIDLLIAEALQDYAEVVIAARMPESEDGNA